MATEESGSTPSIDNIVSAINDLWDMREPNFSDSTINQCLLKALGTLRITLQEESPTDEEKHDIYSLSAVICGYLQDWNKLEEFYKLANSIEQDTLWAEIAYTRFQLAKYGEGEITSLKNANKAVKKLAVIFKESYQVKNPDAFYLMFDATLFGDLAFVMEAYGIKMDPFFQEALLEIPWDSADTQYFKDPDNYYSEVEGIISLFNGLITILT